MFSFWHHIAIAFAVSVSHLLIASPAASGQTTSTDTATGAQFDTLAAPRDSLPAPGASASVARDTLDTIPRPGSDSVPAAGSADTSPSPSDSLAAAAARDSAPPAAPVDSTLRAACGGP